MSSPSAPLRAVLPGLGVALLVTAAAVAGDAAETRWLGHPILEALVLAILIGMAVRTAVGPSERLAPGIHLASHRVLEVAVCLLGAAVDLPVLLKAGPALAVGILAVVIVALAAGYGIGRALGLPHPLAVLVATGNAICGNSAIAAVAPVIGARREQVATAIAFTAILGVLVVVGLPLLVTPLHLSHYQYGVLAGLSVYAVPQVLAAAFPVSTVSGQVGTLVKLARVLLLGPVVLSFAWWHRRTAASAEGTRPHLSLARALPWFIVGFVILAAARALGWLGAPLVDGARLISSRLTVVAMAGLGLGVDVRTLRGVGGRVIATVTASLVVLIACSLLMIRGLGLP